jgi:hypothetical protein
MNDSKDLKSVTLKAAEISSIQISCSNRRVTDGKFMFFRYKTNNVHISYVKSENLIDL